jgi:hypothetical protein
VLPLFYTDFNVDEFNSKKASDVLAKVVSTFGLDCEWPILLTRGSEVHPNEKAKRVILNARSDRFVLRVTLTEKGKSRVTTRSADQGNPDDGGNVCA